MNTGLGSFNNPGDIGALYPFVGTEVILVVIGVVAWLAWHFIQNRQETAEDDEGVRQFNEIGKDRILYHGGTARIAREDELRGHTEQGAPHQFT